MERFTGKPARALGGILIALALLSVALWGSAPYAAASAAPTMSVTGFPGPGDDLVIGAETGRLAIPSVSHTMERRSRPQRRASNGVS